jgi:hypothetical protein
VRSTMKNIFARLDFAVTVSLFASVLAFAQESAPGPVAAPAIVTPVGPAATLRDALSAACAHNEKDFGRFFTAGNREAFARMTAAARISLMKRFVLLDDQGQPSVSANPAGRPIVRCTTSIGAAEMQIGGADLHESLAFLPLEIRDATDPTGNVMHIKIGMIREAGEWKILTLGLLLLDLPALEAEWDVAETGSNEGAALRALKGIAIAIESYRRAYTRLPDSLGALAPPLQGKATAQAADFLDSETASGHKNGYTFRYVLRSESTSGAQARYELAATPTQYGRGGNMSFFRDADGKFHAADHQGAVGSSSDPPVD